MKKEEFQKLLLSIAVCQGAGFISSFFMQPSISTWYASLKKPYFTPPNWLFAPVWVTLYFLMSLALFIIWRKGINKKKSKIALGFFILQLILNMLWTPVFFGLKSPEGGFIIISVMILTAFFTIDAFMRVSKFASSLFLPYLFWLSFAGILNFSIIILNLR